MLCLEGTKPSRGRGSADGHPDNRRSYKTRVHARTRPHNYCLLGATGEALADYLRRRPAQAIDNWIATHPDFAGAVRRGRAVGRRRGRPRLVRGAAVGVQPPRSTRTTLYRGERRTVAFHGGLPARHPAPACFLAAQRRFVRLVAGQSGGDCRAVGVERHGGAARCRRRACAMPAIERALPRTSRAEVERYLNPLVRPVEVRGLPSGRPG